MRTARVSLTDATMCMNFINESLFKRSSDIVRHLLVIVIFYCANTTALDMPDWKVSEGSGDVKLSCKMGRCMKNVENHFPNLTLVLWCTRYKISLLRVHGGGRVWSPCATLEMSNYPYPDYQRTLSALYLFRTVRPRI